MKDMMWRQSLLSRGGHQNHQKQTLPDGSLCFALVVPQFLRTCALLPALRVAWAERRSLRNGVEGLQK